LEITKIYCVQNSVIKNFFEVSAARIASKFN